LISVLPIILQEQRIRKLLLVEKHQAFVRVERIEKNLALNIFLIIFGIIIATLLITQTFPSGTWQLEITLILLVLFGISIIGLYFVLVFSDRGDMVIIKDTFEVQPTEQERKDLEYIIPRVNS
jgi:hypothetical protein